MKKVNVFLQVDASIMVELDIPENLTNEQIIEMAYNKVDVSDLQFIDFVLGSEEICGL